MSASIMQYGVIKGFLEHNVAHGLKDVLKKPATTNQAMLSADDFVTFIRRLKGDSTLSERSRIGLWIVLYTLCRTIEVRRMERSEIDLKTMTWEVAAEKMKMRRPHRMPLPTQAKPLIERLMLISEDQKYLFPVQRQRKVPRYPYASENLLSDALYSLGFKDKGTVHGLRSNGDSTLNRFKSQFGWDSDIIEAQLAHLPKNAMRKIYNREDYLDERRPMMQWWADYLDSI
jgi:integrase